MASSCPSERAKIQGLALRQLLGIDGQHPLRCPKCGGLRHRLITITDPLVARKTLRRSRPFAPSRRCDSRGSSPPAAPPETDAPSTGRRLLVAAWLGGLARRREAETRRSLAAASPGEKSPSRSEARGRQQSIAEPRRARDSGLPFTPRPRGNVDWSLEVLVRRPPARPRKTTDEFPVTLRERPALLLRETANGRITPDLGLEVLERGFVDSCRHAKSCAHGSARPSKNANRHRANGKKRPPHRPQ